MYELLAEQEIKHSQKNGNKIIKNNSPAVRSEIIEAFITNQDLDRLIFIPIIICIVPSLLSFVQLKLKLSCNKCILYYARNIPLLSSNKPQQAQLCLILYRIRQLFLLFLKYF